MDANPTSANLLAALDEVLASSDPSYDEISHILAEGAEFDKMAEEWVQKADEYLAATTPQENSKLVWKDMAEEPDNVIKELAQALKEEAEERRLVGLQLHQSIQMKQELANALVALRDVAPHQHLAGLGELLASGRAWCSETTTTLANIAESKKRRKELVRKADEVLAATIPPQGNSKNV